MNQKISKGMFVKIHPEFREEKTPQALSDRINYTLIDHVRNSPLKVIDIYYMCVYNSSFYEFLVDSNNQEVIQFRIKFNIDSTVVYRNGDKCILMARLKANNGSAFRLPICFLRESLDVPLSIY